MIGMPHSKHVLRRSKWSIFYLFINDGAHRVIITVMETKSSDGLEVDPGLTLSFPPKLKVDKVVRWLPSLRDPERESEAILPYSWGWSWLKIPTKTLLDNVNPNPPFGRSPLVFQGLGDHVNCWKICLKTTFSVGVWFVFKWTISWLSLLTREKAT